MAQRPALTRVVDTPAAEDVLFDARHSTAEARADRPEMPRARHLDGSYVDRNAQGHVDRQVCQSA